MLDINTLRAIDRYEPEWLIWGRHRFQSYITIEMVDELCGNLAKYAHAPPAKVPNRCRIANFVADFINFQHAMEMPEKHIPCDHPLVTKYIDEDTYLTRVNIDCYDMQKILIRKPELTQVYIMLLCHNPNLRRSVVMYLYSLGAQKMHWNSVIQIINMDDVDYLSGRELYHLLWKNPSGFPLSLLDKVCEYGELPCIENATPSFIAHTAKKYSWNLPSFCSRKKYTIADFLYVWSKVSKLKTDKKVTARLVSRNCVSKFEDIIMAVGFHPEIVFNRAIKTQHLIDHIEAFEEHDEILSYLADMEPSIAEVNIINIEVMAILMGRCKNIEQATKLFRFYHSHPANVI